MDLDSFLTSLYVSVNDWWQTHYLPTARKPGRPALLADSEVLTLAILAQWPRFRGERDFWRFASAHLRGYFPDLCSQSQFNRRVRALEPEMRAAEGLRQRARRAFGSLSRPGHLPHPGDCESEGVPEGAVRRAGLLREERIQDRVGLWVQGGVGRGPARRGERFLTCPGGLGRKANRGRPRASSHSSRSPSCALPQERKHATRAGLRPVRWPFKENERGAVRALGSLSAL